MFYVFVSTAFNCFFTPIFSQSTIAPIWQQQIDAFEELSIHRLSNNRPLIGNEFYAKHARIMPQFQSAILGQEFIDNYYTAFLNRFKVIAYDKKVIEILDLGEVIIETGEFNMDINNLNTHINTSLSGYYRNVWQKITDDKIEIIAEAWNYNHWVDIAKELTFPNLPSLPLSTISSQKKKAQINQILENKNRLTEEVVTNHDATKWKKMFSEDASYIYSYAPIFLGKKAVDHHIEAHCKGLPRFDSLSVNHHNYEVFGEYVLVFGHHYAIVTSDNYRDLVSTGKDLKIFRKQTNGDYKIFRQMAMYDFIQQPITIDKINNLNQILTSTEINKNIDGRMALYTKNPICMPDQQTSMQGFSSLKNYHQQVANRFKLQQFEKIIKEIFQLNGRIIEIGNFKRKGINTTTQKTFSQEGKYFNIWFLDKNQDLKLAVESWNYDHPIDDKTSLIYDVPKAKNNGLLDSQKPLTDNQQIEIEAIRTLMEKGVKTRDGELRAAIYSEDGIFMPHGEPMMVGKAQILAHLINYNRGEVIIDKVQVSTNWAEDLDDFILESYSYEVEWRFDTFAGVGQGKGLRLWKRLEDGTLKIYRLIALEDYIPE